MDGLRQKVNKWIETFGTPKKWFADKLGISHTHFGLWLKGEREFSELHEQRLRDIIEQKLKL